MRERCPQTTLRSCPLDSNTVSVLVLCTPLRGITRVAPDFPWETLSQMNFNTIQLQRKPPPIINHVPHKEPNLLSPPPLPLHPQGALLPLGIKLSRSTLGREGLKRKLRNSDVAWSLVGKSDPDRFRVKSLYFCNFLPTVFFFFF